MILCYDGTDVRMHRYVDSDFAGDVDSQKSTTDYVFNLWSSELGIEAAKIVPLSTTEAEYVATTETCKELI